MGVLWYQHWRCVASSTRRTSGTPHDDHLYSPSTLFLPSVWVTQKDGKIVLAFFSWTWVCAITPPLLPDPYVLRAAQGQIRDGCSISVPQPQWTRALDWWWRRDCCRVGSGLLFCGKVCLLSSILLFTSHCCAGGRNLGFGYPTHMCCHFPSHLTLQKMHCHGIGHLHCCASRGILLLRNNPVHGVLFHSGRHGPRCLFIVSL